MQPPEAILVDKPAGPTSHDLVSGIRRTLPKGIKVGHAGTLDPFATGLLIILVGSATRCQSLFMELDKTYEVTARFGAVSTTGDPEGEISETGRVPKGELALPTGRIRQRPPAYSAVRIDGERAYRRARRGEKFETSQREVVIHEFVETSREGDRRTFRIRCSSGTYIRSLISDLGDAFCLSLRRTAIGPFAAPGPDRTNSLPLLDALTRFVASAEVTEQEALGLLHGRSVGIATSGVTVLHRAGEPLALGQPDQAGGTAPFAVLRQ